MPAGQFIMSVSQPGCPLCGEAGIVQRTAVSGNYAAAASLETIQAVKYHGQELRFTPVPMPKCTRISAKGIPFSLLSSNSIRAPYHRAGALLQRRDYRQQADISIRLSDVLFILNEENISKIITNH
jgi:hypothetical protein